MAHKLNFKRVCNAVLCRLLFVPALIVVAFTFINASYAQKITGNNIQSYIQKQSHVETVNGFFNYVENLFQNISLRGKIADDTIPFRIIKKDTANVTRYLISGRFLLSGDNISFSLNDSLLLNYKKWNAAPGNLVTYTPQGLLATGFLLSNDSARITLANQQSQPGSPVEISIQNFDCRDLAGFFYKDSLMLSGLLNANIMLNELDKTLTAFIATASINNFEWMQQTLGNLQLNAQLADSNAIHTAISLAGNGNEINIAGNYFINNKPQQVDALMNIKKLQVAALQGLLKDNLSRVSGVITGAIALNGRLSRPGWKGELNIDTVQFTSTKFGSSYTIARQKILLDYPAIVFNRFTIKDSLGHPLIIDGAICYNAFNKYDLDLNITSSDFSIVNAPKAINNKFYGNAGMNAKLSVTGTNKKPLINGDIYLDKNNNITLVLPEKNADKDVGSSVVKFIKMDGFALPVPDKYRAAAAPRINIERYLNKKFNIHVGRQAALNIIIDAVSGDSLTVYGDALLNAGVDTGKNLVMAGNYILDSGYYELNYQFLKRRFNVLKGSAINFGGDATDAQIDIRCEYIANTAPKDLLGNEVGSVDTKTTRSFYQAIPFRVVLFLKGSLKNPLISFDIQLPEAVAINSRLRTTIENKLVQLRADVDATNKQVFALLALGRFVGDQGTDFFKGNGGDFAGIARESVSRFLASALDQIASDLFKGINVDLNLNSYKDFTTSEGVQKTDLNVEVSKNFLNDRLSVTVGKNFGIESQDGSARAAKQKGSRFLPDATVNYKLSTDGKYMLRSYTKNPFEVILDGYVVESGLAFIVTMDYENFEELFIKKNKKTGQQ